MWAKRMRKIKPYPTIPAEVKDYFLEPSDLDDIPVAVLVSVAVSFGFALGFVYGLAIGG